MSLTCLPVVRGARRDDPHPSRKLLAASVAKAVASRLGHTSTRMMDTVYVEVYSEVSRQVADAIDVLVRESTRPASS
jgi:integrase